MANGAEVGSGHVSIFPVMNGFRSRVQKEMQAAGKSGASQFGNAFNGAGGKIGKQLGGNLKGSFDQVTAALGESTLKKLQGDVAKSSQAYSTALIKSKDAALNVRDAEDKLAAAIAKHGEGSIQAEKAALRLESAQLKQKAASEGLTDASEKLRAAQEVLRATQAELAKSSDTAAGMFKRFTAGFKTSYGDLYATKGVVEGMPEALGLLARAVSGIDLFKPISDKAKGLASDLRTQAVAAGNAFAQGFGGTVSGGGAIQTTFNSLGLKARGAATAVTNAFNGVRAGVTGAFNGVRNGVSTALSGLGSVASSVAAKIPAPFRNVGSAIATPFRASASLVKSYLSPIGTAGAAVMNNLPAAARSAASGIANAFRGIGASVSGELSKIGGALKGLSAAGVGAAAAGVGALSAKIASMVPDAIAASDATDKFKSTLNFAGLDTTTIDRLTASTQKYADQTVYDLADIQSVTAQLAANGVPNYDRLAEAAGNLNAVAGGNKDTFKSVAMVLTQTAGQGKLTTENFNQLSDAIPGASGKIQEALKNAGAYTGNFRDAMANGEITAQKFNDALMQLGMTDVAQKAATATTTFEGAWGNFEAAITGGLKRIIDAIKPFATTVLNGLTGGLTTAFDAVGGAVETVVAKIGPIFDGLKGSFSNIAPIIAPVAAAFTALGVGALGPLIQNLPIVGGMFGNLGKALGVIGGPIGMVVAAIAALIATTPSLRDAFGAQMSALFSRFGAEMQTLKPTFDQLVASIQGMVNQIMPVITQAMGMLIPMIGQIIQALLPLIPTVIQPIMEAMNMIMPVIGQLVSSLLPPLMNIITSFTPLIASLIAAIGQIIGTITSAVMPIIQQVMQAVSQLISTITPIIQSLQPVVQQVVQAIIGLIQALLPIIQDIITVVGNVVQTVVGFITGTFLPAFQSMVPFIQNVISSIGNIIEGIVNVVKGVVNVVSGIIHGDWNQVWEGFKQIASGAIQALGGIFNGIKNAVVGAVAGAGTWLANAGHQIIQGLIDGIGGAMGWLQSTISNLGSSVVSWAKGVLGIHSPSRIFRDQVGKWIPLGMSEGIEKTLPTARATVAKASSTLTDAADVAATGTITAKTVTETDETNGMRATAAGTQQLTAEAITMAILTALRQVGAFDLKVDLRTLAMLITPLVSAEQGKAQTLG